MSIELFKQWVSGIPETATLNKFTGHWLSFEANSQREYMSIIIGGGANPREVNTEFATVEVTLVAAKGDTPANILSIAKAMREYSEQRPPQCGIVAVNALGAVRGPFKTDGERQAVNFSFEMIY